MIPATLTLNNGNKIPIKGLGTFLSLEFDTDYLRTAIKLGYRHIDTAFFYRNEHLIGNALEIIIKEGLVKREDLYITTKILNGQDLSVDDQIEKSLRELKTDYIDLLLIHWPVGKVLESGTDKIRQEPLHKLWAKLEGYVKAGKLRSIGVSNFNCQLLLDLLSYAEIKPVMNQIEIHPYLQQTELVKFCHRFNIHVTAYSPFAKGDGGAYTDGVHHVFTDKVLVDIAAKHKRTVGQVILNWLASRNIVVIPKTIKTERLLENLVFEDFTLDKEDLDRIASLNDGWKIVDPRNDKLKGFFDNLPLFN